MATTAVAMAIRRARVAREWDDRIAKIDPDYQPVHPGEPVKRVTCSACGKPCASSTLGRPTTRCAPCGVRAHVAQARAASAVKRAIFLGELRPAREFTCTDCPRQATEYDHRDYAHPLIVQPVCTRCNSLRGPAAPFNKFIAAKQTSKSLA